MYSCLEDEKTKNKKPLALDSAWIVWHVLISFKKQ